MAILNRASDGLVSVFVTLVRSNIVFGKMPRQKLLDICCPKSLVGDKQEKGTQTLNRWHELGLFVISDNDQIQVAENFRGKLENVNATTSEIAAVALEIILSEQNNLNFWSAEENKASDFTRAAAWMLSQDVHAFAPKSHPEVGQVCNSQAVSAETILLQNNTRWNGYVSWATFLGLGRTESGRQSGGFVTEPTPVVRRYSSSMLPKTGEISVNEFLETLSASVPILDGGKYRREVESKLNPNAWKAPQSGDFSTSLSRSLLRLRSAGEIRLENRSDAVRRMRLVGRNGEVIDGVTHVARGGAV